jgi:tetratricopeptide (TPR) repeat protein
VIEPIALRTRSATYARAVFYNVLGNVEIWRDHRDKAREYFARGLTESQKLTGKIALEFLPARINLVLVSEDRTRADERLAELDAELTHQVGADHPDVLQIRRLRGFATIEDLPQAARLLAPVCGAYERNAALAAQSAPCWTEVGLLRMDLGDREGAIEAMTRAVRASSEAREAAAYTTLWAGNAQAAVQQFADAVVAVAPKSNEHLRERASRARLALGLGRARRDRKDLRGAREALEGAIADLEPVVHEHADTSYERLLGRARVELAFTLSAMGARAPERVAVAKAAAEWLRRAGASPVELTKVEALARE